MKYFNFILLSLLLTACGTYRVAIDDPEATVTLSGESYSYIVVRLEFISQLIELCSALVLDSEYSSLELANQARAQCVFDKLSDLPTDLPTFQDDIDTVCSQPPETLTPEQLAQLEAVCTSL